MGGGRHRIPATRLRVCWSALPAPQIVDYRNGVLYVDCVTWQAISSAQRWAVVDALRGLRLGEHLQVRGAGDRARLERACAQLAAVSDEQWALLVEAETAAPVLTVL